MKIIDVASESHEMAKMFNFSITRLRAYGTEVQASVLPDLLFGFELSVWF